jgi:hypothetical protein
MHFDGLLAILQRVALQNSPAEAKLSPMDELPNAPSRLALVALSALEIVLCVDNLVFIAVRTGGLPPVHRSLPRRVVLVAAVAGRNTAPPSGLLAHQP